MSSRSSAPGPLGARPALLAVDGEDPDPLIVERAAGALRSGKLLVYPTDTLYALGGSALDGDAARRVRLAKGRQEGKPLPLIAADIPQAMGLARNWDETTWRLAERFWPGPLTLVVPCRPGLPFELTQGAVGVAIRVPALRLARELCSRAGPLISTSANRSGAAPPTTCAEAVAQVGFAAEIALDAGAGGPLASTLVDLLSGTPRLLRAGAVPWSAILASGPGSSRR